jgi:O-antigen/teichoic acid export membrane protein
MKQNLSFYAFFYIGSMVIMRGSGILAKILLARSITPYEYGLITLFVIALPGMFQIITNFCFFDILGHSSEGKKYFGFSLLYGVISTIALALLFLIFQTEIFTFLNISPGSWGILYIVLFSVIFSVTLGGDITGLLRGVRNHSLAATYSAAPSILRLIFIFLAVYLFGLNNFFIILIIFALPPVLSLLSVVILKFNTIKNSVKSISIPNKEMFLFGFSFFILNAWVSLSQSINSVVISHDLGVTWQGYFDVSSSFAALITFFSSAVYLIAVPETSSNNDRFETLNKVGGLGDIGKMLFSLCLLSVILIYFYANQMILFLFTANYATSAEYLFILAIGYTILFVQQFVGFLNISSHDTANNKLALVTVASILLFPIFSHLMISYLNFLGAYLSTMIFILIYTTITILLVKDRTPLKLLFEKGDRLFLSFGITVVLLYFIHPPFLWGICLGALSFLVAIIATDYIEKDRLMSMIKNVY